eukprot:CAMPEP_0114440370 /NCGR_PEP_ID=MMETSP0103-20121206/15738_1 /TAXON_ID=37642 ORGANISM="Paraphysomonas imperforata, Strain PA2" /NCGR_SAMPLE_ID=MMETSP0103 /ASSEMBLY_ACC=CAM_ASM_000201 /LENGTH=111 /DNA_ID=CAMNT_0001611279 /DNA_START=201 /DNA_END=532 /DNA_ORIENTATION=-
MTGCAVLEIFTFDLVGYLQPAVRLGAWRVLISLLGVLVNVLVPALLGVSLVRSRSPSPLPALELKGLLLSELNARNIAAGTMGVMALQGVVWVLLEVLPLRLSEAHTGVLR